jgi:hypothetical protein
MALTIGCDYGRLLAADSMISPVQGYGLALLDHGHWLARFSFVWVSPVSHLSHSLASLVVLKPNCMGPLSLIFRRP